MVLGVPRREVIAHSITLLESETMPFPLYTLEPALAREEDDEADNVGKGEQLNVLHQLCKYHTLGQKIGHASRDIQRQ